ncbi:MAG: redox-regulated ATPase YchF [Dehalogenimonas sp.]|uniref:Redox-regulated ATPase YchF n=1 Tax=Candidatus Dehalogenimonas loeffleri TaxID=3127115 RepID=A0ABZ2JCA1_9CHLR|nr:redox-regulated ATPase YchF [Dehalogenimonas sp.]
MSLDIGIIGLAQSGRTTIFQAATGGAAAKSGEAAHVGVARVPDARIDKLTGMFNPKKTTFAEVKYLDLGASVKSLAQSGVGGEALRELSNMDELINVVRAFEDETVPHPQITVDAARDIEAMNLELTFSDLAILERRLGRIEQSLKSAKAIERPKFIAEQDLLARLKGELEKDIPLRDVPLDAEEERTISGYQFLSAKPLLIVVNIGEEDLARVAEIEQDLSARFSGKGCRVIAMCGRLEAELAAMDADSAAEFRSDYGLVETGLARTVRASYELLELISFFTVGPDEVRAWSISAGLPAQQAAGKIHSDIERGFIRAEVVAYDDLIRTGSMAEAKKQGVLRLEGKTYIVKDGDIAHFLFNV